MDWPSGPGPIGPRACQLLGILLWMHKGLGYIYAQCRVTKGELAREASRKRACRSRTMGYAPKGNGYEHRAIHRQRSEGKRRRAVHEGYAAVSPVRLFRPGGADPRSRRGRLQGPE